VPLQISQNSALKSLIPLTVGPFSGAELSKSGGRDIHAASIRIHGITPDMVAGQPTIGCCQPFTPLSAIPCTWPKTAVFDMRFLHRKEARPGCASTSRCLTRSCYRRWCSRTRTRTDSRLSPSFDIPVIGRHTAPGDALVTAEVFQKLVSLIVERGIHTLGEARSAAQQSY
jgi:DNA polymerase-3 subunit epsilon